MNEASLEEKASLEEDTHDSLVILHLLEYFKTDMGTGAQSYWDPLYHTRYMKKFNITPDLIKKIIMAMPELKTGEEISPFLKNKYGIRIKEEYIPEVYMREKGNFISTLIQASYEQGFNNFEFEKINATDFGAHLKGKKDRPMVVNIEEVKGDATFGFAENVVVEIKKNMGTHFFQCAQNFVVKIEELYSSNAFHRADNFIAEVGKFGYNEPFGFMAFGKVYCPDKGSLSRMKNPVGGLFPLPEELKPDCIKFVYGKMQDKPLEVYTNHVNNKSVYQDCKKEEC